MRLENSSTISSGGSTKSGEQTGEKRLYKRFMGIMPAFRHRLSGETHLSCDEHGSLAPIHRLDNLPECWLSFNGDKTECTLKKHIEKGYVVMGHFMNQNGATHLLPH